MRRSCFDHMKFSNILEKNLIKMNFELFTVVYFMLCVSLIYPPAEFVMIGLTIENAFGRFLGNPFDNFILYHVRRSMASLMAFSLFPFGYIFAVIYYEYITENDINISELLSNCKLFTTVAFILPSLAFYQIQKWQKHNFAEHPTIKNLSKYINEEHPTWTQIAGEINAEYRRVTKVLLEVNPITSVVITDNWILKIDLFETHIAKISDTDMLVSESREFSVTDDLGDHQMLKVDFNSVDGKFKNFQINMFVSGLRQVESQLQRQIRMAPGITVHRTEAEMFLAAFANAVKKNPKYTATEESEDRCIGCFQAAPNVKLNRNCIEGNVEGDCGICRCRPSWCLSCLGQWFLTRQDPQQRNRWLSSKCTCPMCRAKFCLLDVCMLADS
ncbi:E3 ubiquitin-protein ligase TM129 [Aethina tumida]|uniref:E3 ubiquitin-protein ligase TM129 n=1 Tax=Aethina tumida TaxID=116153 RepID=UPI00214928BB|nr:E3 ubiquitin-protein ligase TM129 [Aethina tumida]